MSRVQLAAAIRKHGERIMTAETYQRADDRDTYELVLCLARLVEGKTLHDAFGAPGDWGYNTDIGRALAAREKEAA